MSSRRMRRATTTGGMALLAYLSVATSSMLLDARVAEAECSGPSDCPADEHCVLRSGASTPYCTCDEDRDCDSDEYCRVELRICTPIATIVCGNGELEPGEQCDDGAMNSDGAPDACRTNCRSAYCGDGVIDTGEECDDVSGNSDYEPDVCRLDCTPPSCGDGVRDPGHDEECDEGEMNSLDGECAPNCQLAGCGDGLLDGLETCDDGNDVDGDGCTNACIYNVCGDGVVWTGAEQCEYAMPWDPAGCRYDCGQDTTVCGDSTVDPGEGCDDGLDRNGDDPDLPCRSDCQPQRCGDGIVDTGEECDLQPGCAPDCTWITPR